MFYQQLSVSLSFTVLHSHLTGWVKGSKNAFYFGSDVNSSGDGKYLYNFPHGGTNAFTFGGLDPVPVTPPDSTVDQDPTAGGANPDIADKNTEQITKKQGS